MSTFDGPTESKKSATKTSNACLVCGDGASIVNYGALSCFSCRTFFRRNAFTKKELLACRYDGICEINMLTRKICTACRLAKCFTVGMTPDLIRREDLAAANKKPKNEELTTMTIAHPSSLSLSDGVDCSQLNASDHTLISNIIYAFDTFSPVAEVRQIIEMLNTSASDFQYDISQSLGITSMFYNSLQLFISSTPDFKILTPAEQCSLFQRNMLGLLCLGGMYLMSESEIFDKPENEIILLPLYGPEAMQQAKTICQQLNSEPILFKIMLVALAFSSNCYMLRDHRNLDKDSLLLGTFRLLGSQNVYVELMWKYLIHTYNHQLAVQKFSTLIKQLLDTWSFSIDLYTNNQIHQAFIDSTIEQMEQPSAVNEKSNVPLWGKRS